MGCYGGFLRFSGDVARRPSHILVRSAGEDGLVLNQPLTSTLILKFAIGPLVLWEPRLGSDSRSPKARHRFGFSGLPTSQKERVTTDDILDSLTRQAELRQKLGEDDPVRLEEIARTEDLIRFQGFTPEPMLPPVGAKRRSLGHLAFVLMLLTGLAIVWLYSSILKPFDLASLNSIIQKSGLQSVFANQARLGIIVLAALICALWIRHKRRGSSLRLLAR